MRTNDSSIIKHIIAFQTSLGCYADDVWIIPLQHDLSNAPDIYDNGVIDNHHQPYIELSHSDDELPEIPGKKNPWRVQITRLNEDDEYEIYGTGVYKTAHEALNSNIVQYAIAKSQAHRQASTSPMFACLYS